MKRLFLTLLGVCAIIGVASAQNLTKPEAKALQAFLAQPAAKGGNNAEAIGLTGNSVASAPGVKIENGHVTEIDWHGFKLSGDLNLSGFPALQKVDVSDNSLSTPVY